MHALATVHVVTLAPVEPTRIFQLLLYMLPLILYLPELNPVHPPVHPPGLFSITISVFFTLDRYTHCVVGAFTVEDDGVVEGVEGSVLGIFEGVVEKVLAGVGEVGGDVGEGVSGVLSEGSVVSLVPRLLGIIQSLSPCNGGDKNIIKDAIIMPAATSRANFFRVSFCVFLRVMT